MTMYKISRFHRAWTLLRQVTETECAATEKIYQYLLNEQCATLFERRLIIDFDGPIP